MKFSVPAQGHLHIPPKELLIDVWICSFPRQTFNITVIQVYAPTSNAEEAEVEWFYEDQQDLLELTLKKVYL